MVYMNKTSIPNVIRRVAGGGRSFYIKLGTCVSHIYRDIVKRGKEVYCTVKKKGGCRIVKKKRKRIVTFEKDTLCV